MKIRTSLILAALILCAGNLLFAQAPSISYASSPASLLINTAVGTSPNPSLTVTNSGGAAVNVFTATTFAGSTSGTAGLTNNTGTAARFSTPNGITVDNSGNFYVADQTNNEIRKMTSAGVVTLLAGSATGVAGRANATGSSATFSAPKDVTTDNTNLYVADSTNNEIRKIVISSGVVTLLAGSTTGVSGRANGTTTAATFNGPSGIAYSSSATAMYVSDYVNNEIRKVTTAGVVTLLAGSSTGASGMANGTTTAASFNHPAGIAVDGSGNIYVADQGNNQIRKVTSAGVVTLLAGSATGVAGSTDGTGTAASFNSPTGITVDAAGLIYVYDRGTGLLRTVTAAGVVTTVAGSGTPGYTDAAGTSAQFRGAGIVTDASKNIFLADRSNNTIRKITITTPYSITPALPTGLTFNTTTGAITGTPTVSTAPANYTITATNYSGSSNATLNLNVYNKRAWTGGTSTAWATTTNWTGSVVPSTWDQVTIGSTTAYTNLPLITTAVTVGSIIMGTSDISSNTSPSITVNSPGSLTVTNDITYQSDANSLTNTTFVAALSGNSSISAKNLNIIANTVLNSYTLKLTSSVTTLNLSGDINLTSTYTNGSQIDNSTFTISGGTVTVTDFNTTNGANAASTSTLVMSGTSTLNFTDPTALANLSSNGTNTLTLGSTSTIGYTASAAQTVYTDAAITGLPSGISYQNLTLSGTGIKTASSGNLNVAGNFTNSLANDASNYVDFTTNSTTAVFNGAAQSIAVGSGLGTTFDGVTFSGTGIKTVSSGIMNITGNYTNSLANDASNKPDFITNSTPVNFTGAAQTISCGSGLGTTFKDITFSGTGIKTVSSGIMNITGNFTNSLANDASNKPDFTTNSTPVNFTGAAQTISCGSGLGTTFKDITFSGTGIKTVSSGIINIAGNFTNSLANDASNYVDFTTNSTPISFTGTTQSLAGGSGTGTNFEDVTFSGGGTKTIASGKINITSAGTLTLSGSSTLAAGGFLTLRSDVNGSATVAPIPSGSSVTGDVNVERYIQGGQSYSRGYRLISSPVSVGSGSLIYPNLTYISAKTYTTGTGGTGNGFDASGNPTMYLYREDIPPNFSSFISGNSRGVAKINAGSSFNIDTDGSSFTIPAGNGVLLFFRGDKATTTNPTVVGTTALATTFTATGYLNQGDVVVRDWFTPASTNLSYTSATPASVIGFNLVGNPYASSIDWDLVRATGIANISNSIWVYNPKYKAYAVYPGNGTGIGTNADGATSNIIPSGQGFYVRTNAASPTLTFKEAHKVSTQVPASNLMLSATTAPSPITYLRIVLSKDSLIRNDALIFFNSTASPNYLADEDAEYLNGLSDVKMSTRSADNRNLAINQMPFPASRQQIGLNVIVSKSDTYNLDLSEAKNIPARYKIYLVDTYKKDSVDIKKQPVYTFTADTTNANTFGANRFHLVIGQSDSAYRLTDFIAAKSVSGVSLIWKTVNESNNLTFTIERSNDGGATYSLLGSMGSSGLGTYSFVDRSPKAGVNIYRLKQQDVYGGLSYTQVSINYSNGNTGANSVSVYPNPATTTIKLAVTELSKAIADNTLPDYTIAISNNTGSIIKSISTSRPANWQSDISSYAPGMYFLRVINNNTKTVVGNSKFVKL